MFHNILVNVINRDKHDITIMSIKLFDGFGWVGQCPMLPEFISAIFPLLIITSILNKATTRNFRFLHSLHLKERCLAFSQIEEHPHSLHEERCK